MKKVQPELLPEYALEAAKNFIRDDVPLDKSIAKIASVEELTDVQTRTVCQLANRYVHKSKFKDSSFVSFPVSTLEGVEKEKLASGMREVVEKKASSFEPDLPVLVTAKGGFQSSTSGWGERKVEKIANLPGEARSKRISADARAMEAARKVRALFQRAARVISPDEILAACLAVDTAVDVEACVPLCVEALGEKSFSEPDKFTGMTLDTEMALVKALVKVALLHKASQKLEKGASFSMVPDPVKKKWRGVKGVAERKLIPRKMHQGALTAALASGAKSAVAGGVGGVMNRWMMPYFGWSHLRPHLTKTVGGFRGAFAQAAQRGMLR